MLNYNISHCLILYYIILSLVIVGCIVHLYCTLYKYIYIYIYLYIFIYIYANYVEGNRKAAAPRRVAAGDEVSLVSYRLSR